jgi:hypothetical protein
VTIDRDALIDVIDELHEEACISGRPLADRLAAALGWDNPDKWPEGPWIRERLDEALR